MEHNKKNTMRALDVPYKHLCSHSMTSGEFCRHTKHFSGTRTHNSPEMLKDVLDLIREVIAHCQVCKNQQSFHPSTCPGEPTSSWDVAARYKSVGKVDGKDLITLPAGAASLLDEVVWSSLLSIEATAECERRKDGHPRS